MAKAKPKPTTKTPPKPPANGAHPPSEVMTLAEAAAFLRVGADGLRADAEAGRVPGKRVDGEWRFSRPAILAWLAGESSPATARPPAGVGAGYTDENPEELIAAIYRERKKHPVGG